ncbi:MAG: hypothetical protein JSV19_08265 [Phycisphaerales bacterium]|nr:MAG: hypothetical protein JSV19_08265 [Phycisphaerales bacterium]
MTNHRPAPHTDPKDAIDLSSWKQRLRDLPDLRWDKVVAIRDALRNRQYEVETRVDRLICLMANEIGVLCRRENWAADNDPLDLPRDELD